MSSVKVLTDPEKARPALSVDIICLILHIYSGAGLITMRLRLIRCCHPVNYTKPCIDDEQGFFTSGLLHISMPVATLAS
jgi:hypothetical protein